jgi:cell division septal protein FtsQ
MSIIRRTWMLAIVLVLVFVGWSGYLWLRDFSIFKVSHVEITGLDSREAPAIRRALRQEATQMTTLHVNEAQLKQAVDAFPVVRSLSASAKFPKTLRIKVNEYVPVAALVTAGGRRVAVSSSGKLLRGVGPGAKLPAIKVDEIPTTGTLEDPAAQRLVTAVSGAPGPLRPLLAKAYDAKDGIRVAFRGGLMLHFGDSTRLAAKWASAARVLADTSSRGAGSLDVRVPQRPAAAGKSGSESAAPVAG